MGITYCTMKEIAKQAQGKYINNDAVRAAVDVEGDILQSMLAIGVALGKHEDRKRLRKANPTILRDVFHKDSEACSFHRSKSYRLVGMGLRARTHDAGTDT